MNIFSCAIQLHLPGDHFRNLGSISGQLTDHKCWELQHMYSRGCVFDFHVSVSHQQDHAGMSVQTGLFGYQIRFDLYDSRHWDYDANKWECIKTNAVDSGLNNSVK